MSGERSGDEGSGSGLSLFSLAAGFFPSELGGVVDERAGCRVLDVRCLLWLLFEIRWRVRVCVCVCVCV